MTDRKPFAASVRAPLPKDVEPHAGPTDELGYPLDEPAPAVITGDDRFPEDVNLLVTALGCIGFTGTLVLDHGVIYGEQISRLDLSVDWTILQAGTGRRLACIKYDLRPSEGTWARWRARATEMGIAIILLKRCGAAVHRQEVWDRIRAVVAASGLGVAPAEPPGDGVANTRREQPAEQRTEQADAPADGPENALATHPGDATAGAAPQGHAHEERKLDRLVAQVKGPATPLLSSWTGRADPEAGSAGHALRTSGDPGTKSRAGRELARWRWGRRGS